MADRPASLRRTILVWLVLATAAIGALALLDTRIEALRTARDVSDRVLIGSAMAIAEGVSVSKRSNLSKEAAQCVADVVDRRRVGTPESPMVGATVLVKFTKLDKTDKLAK